MRLIDADKLKTSLSTCSLLCSPGSSGALAFEIVLEVLDDQPTFAQPPNLPLTLEDLRKMDGEPVWVADLLIPDCSCYHFTQKIDGHVLLMEPRYYPAADVMIPHYCADDENQGYGQTWWAYRRKPEGSR